MNQWQPYDRLLQTLRELRENIQRQIQPFEEEIIRATVNELMQTSSTGLTRLSTCLDEIDLKIIDCHNHLSEYEGIRARLHELNAKMSQLGSEGMPVSDGLVNVTLEDVICERIGHLRSLAKI